MESKNEFNVTEFYTIGDSLPSIPTLQIKQNKLSTDKKKGQACRCRFLGRLRKNTN